MLVKTDLGEFKLMDTILLLIMLFELGMCCGMWMTDATHRKAKREAPRL